MNMYLAKDDNSARTAIENVEFTLGLKMHSYHDSW